MNQIPAEHKLSGRVQSLSRYPVLTLCAIAVFAMAAAVLSLWWPHHREEAAIAEYHRIAGEHGGELHASRILVGPEWLHSRHFRKYAAPFERVKSIQIESRTSIPGKSFLAFRGLHSLEKLEIIGGDTLPDIHGLPELRRLIVRSQEWGVQPREHDLRISDCPRLEEISVQLVRESSIRLKLAGLPSVKRLVLGYGLALPNHDEAFRERVELPSLESLSVSGVSDIGLQGMKHFQRLTELTLGATTSTWNEREQLRLAIPGLRIRACIYDPEAEYSYVFRFHGYGEECPEHEERPATQSNKDCATNAPAESP